MSDAAIDPVRSIVVIVRATTAIRAAEALRAAVGLALRGDKVHAIVPEELSEDEGVARGILTLLLLKHRVSGPQKLAELVRDADAVEVWT